MQRREFIHAATAAGIAGAAAAGTRASASTVKDTTPFRLRYAPHFGMFRNSAGDDLVAQLEFMHDHGFRALEDNGMKGRSVEDQKRIASTMERLDMQMGVFVVNPSTAWNQSFSKADDGLREQFLAECRTSVEVAKRVNAKWMTVVPGTVHPKLEPDYQTANAVEQLRMAADIFEPHGLVMVLEPLNPWRDHPNMLLAKIPHAHLVCRAVNSPSCKILFDIYHQQITEGNLIPNIDLAWDEIGYFQIGDNPGRREPTTGEINYRNVFRHIHAKGFDGILGMEHGNSRGGSEGEEAVIAAYRACDG
jgi:hydroxypyruvate isomerase